MPATQSTGDSSRRQIDELRTIHELSQPHLRDVYVEGRDDMRFFRWYFSTHEWPVTEVYAVDDRVDVPSVAVLNADAEVGSKGRLVVLAQNASKWTCHIGGLLCVVDSDFDCLGNAPEFDRLLRTDYGSLEVYGLQPAPFSHFVSVALGSDADSSEVLANVLPVLNEIFVARAALHMDGQGIPLVESFSNCMKVVRGAWWIDTEQLIKRSLDAGHASSERSRVMEQVETIRARLPDDRLRAVRGHDIAPVTIKVLGLKNNQAKTDVFEQSWRGTCLTPAYLDETPLFRALRARLEAP